MSGDLPLTPDDVADIVAILDGTDYQSIDIATTRFRLRVARAGEGWNQEWTWTDDAAPLTSAEAVKTPVEAAVLPAGCTAVMAPLPGTFYRAPQPGAPPFVQAGDTVHPETVVGIVETMKLMNPVHAGASGMIDDVLVDNSQMVAAGDVLMLLRAESA